MKKYYVESGNWNIKINAKNIMEAATLAVEQIYTSPGNITFGAIIMVWEEKYQIQNLINKQYFVYAPTALANASKYNDAKLLQKKIDLLIKADKIDL